MIGCSVAMKAVETLIDRIAVYSAPVLIQGETGTGKELVARAIHYASPRRVGPFVPINCGALPDALVENELFGHARGAFTDARDEQPGLIALAARGTLFLDEVDCLSMRGQVALLRFLQDQHFRPLGGRSEKCADVRIIAASNCGLAELAGRGAFRHDLFYRLRLFEIHLPPLRARTEDLPALAAHFVEKASAQHGKSPLPLSAATLAWFADYAWPGNVRELEHLIYREFLLADGDVVSISPPAASRAAAGEVAGPPSTLNYLTAKKHAISVFESRFLAHLIAEAGGNISAAARLSGTERRHLGRLLRKHRLVGEPDRQATRM